SGARRRAMSAAMEQARAIADAVLYEGYLLYPYRASAAKNRVRWQWGVLMPPAYAAGGTGERAASHTQLLVEPGPGATLHARLRCLQLQARTVQVPDSSGAGVPGSGAGVPSSGAGVPQEHGGYRSVPSLTAAGVEHTTWEEAVEREVDAVLPFADLLAGEYHGRFTVPRGADAEPVPGARGARVVRRRRPLLGLAVPRARPPPGPFRGHGVRLSG